jgi:hypothetical protein
MCVPVNNNDRICETTYVRYVDRICEIRFICFIINTRKIIVSKVIFLVLGC